MTFTERRLVRHLVLAVLVKLAALMVLWWWFVRDTAVSVDADRAAAQLASPVARAQIPQGALK